MFGLRSASRRIIRCAPSGQWRTVLGSLNKRFEGLYSALGRPSIPPEMLLRATLFVAKMRLQKSRAIH